MLFPIWYLLVRFPSRELTDVNAQTEKLRHCSVRSDYRFRARCHMLLIK